jgi:hypothetical protein
VLPLFGNGKRTYSSALICRLQEQINEIKRAKETVESMVKILLIGHSMGGIVAADTVLSMLDDNDPLYTDILGILAYDTPYFGLNPSAIRRNVSSRVNQVSSAVTSAREWIPQSLFAAKPTQENAFAATPTKSNWGRLAKFAVAGVATVAAVGAASYFAKDPIVNHLQFVSALYKSDELATRMRRVYSMSSIGFVVFYTVINTTDYTDGTFCIIPEDKEGKWIRQENGLANDEVAAHCGMFSRASNDHYDEMTWHSIELIKCWIMNSGH